MLIISQDRMTVVNLDAVARFGVSCIPVPDEEPRPDSEWAILADMSRPVNGAILGRYKSKKRAAEVLEQIVDTYKQHVFNTAGYDPRGANAYIQPFGYIPPKVYTMPEV